MKFYFKLVFIFPFITVILTCSVLSDTGDLVCDDSQEADTRDHSGFMVVHKRAHYSVGFKNQQKMGLWYGGEHAHEDTSIPRWKFEF